MAHRAEEAPHDGIRRMYVTQKQMEDAQIPIRMRDYCAHLLLPYQKCRSANPIIAHQTCAKYMHEYERCQFKEQRKLRTELTPMRPKQAQDITADREAAATRYKERMNKQLDVRKEEQIMMSGHILGRQKAEYRAIERNISEGVARRTAREHALQYNYAGNIRADRIALEKEAAEMAAARTHRVVPEEVLEQELALERKAAEKKGREEALKRRAKQAKEQHEEAVAKVQELDKMDAY